MSDKTPAPVWMWRPLARPDRAIRWSEDVISASVRPRSGPWGRVAAAGKTTNPRCPLFLVYTRRGVELRCGSVRIKAGEPILGHFNQPPRNLRARVVSYVPQAPRGGAPILRLACGQLFYGLALAAPVYCPGVLAFSASRSRPAGRVELGADLAAAPLTPHASCRAASSRRVTSAMMSCVSDPPVAGAWTAHHRARLIPQDLILAGGPLRDDEGMARCTSPRPGGGGEMADPDRRLYAAALWRAALPRGDRAPPPPPRIHGRWCLPSPPFRRPRALRGIRACRSAF